MSEAKKDAPPSVSTATRAVQVAQENSRAQLKDFPLFYGTGQYIEGAAGHKGQEPEAGEHVIKPQVHDPGSAEAPEHFLVGLGGLALGYHPAQDKSRQHQRGQRKKKPYRRESVD